MPAIRIRNFGVDGKLVLASVNEESSVVLIVGVEESPGVLVRFSELSEGIVVSIEVAGGVSNEVAGGASSGVELSAGTAGALSDVEVAGGVGEGSPVGVAGSVVMGGTEGSSVGVVGSVVTGGTVGGAVGSVVTGGVKGVHCGEVKVFVSNVTEPFLAKARPSAVAPVLAVMDVNAKIFPLKLEAVPSVAELPTCQNILQADAPLIRLTLLLEAVVNVDPT